MLVDTLNSISWAENTTLEMLIIAYEIEIEN